MAKRHRVIRRRQDVDPEEDPEEDAAEVAEAEEPEVAEDPEEEPMEEDEPEPAPVSRKARTVAPSGKDGKTAPKATKKPAPVEPEEEEAPAEKKVSVRKIDSTIAGDVVAGLVDELLQGQALLFTKTGSGKFQVTLVDAEALAEKQSGGRRRKSKEYWEEVRSPEYEKWRSEWKNLTFEEKKAKAKKAGAKWEAHENPQIEIMRITEAYREKMGIQKYKPEYASRAARAKVR